MAYGLPFQSFVAPARAKPAVWRLLVGILTMALVYAAIGFGIIFAGGWLFGFHHVEALTLGEGFDNPWAMIWLLSTFIGMLVAPMVAARLLHRRGPGTLFGRGAIVVQDFAKTAGVFLLIGVPLTALWAMFESPSLNLSFAVWLAFLPLAVIGIGVQTLAEELVFRGYLQQQLAARFRSPLVWMILPSIGFGALHFDPSLGGGVIGVMVITGLFGLIAADLTARTGSIGAAWGFHFANNFIGMCLLSADGRLGGLAIFRASMDLADGGIPPAFFALDAVLIIVAWLIVRRVLRR